MTRLIDADAFIEEARSRIDMQDMYLPIHIKEIVLDDMPTVNAVPVVRCKDCRYYGERMASGFWSCTRKEGCARTLPEGFCGWGIPR